MKNINRGFASLPIIIIVLALLGLGGYFYAKKSTPALPTPIPAPAPVTDNSFKTLPAPVTPDPTADWKTYTDTEYGVEIKYPADWTVKVVQADNCFSGPQRDLKCDIGFGPSTSYLDKALPGTISDQSFNGINFTKFNVPNGGVYYETTKSGQVYHFRGLESETLGLMVATFRFTK